MDKFYKNKRVLITGHTGFKGSWLCKILLNLGSDVSGFSLCPPTTPNLFSALNLDKNINSFIGDIRNFNKLQEVFNIVHPDIVFHLAAQPIVRESYKNPHLTYETNVMGTVNILECIRNSPYVQSFVNVTTDKVYHNNEWIWGYREGDALDGFDPYSNSKSCSELVTASYNRSFLYDKLAVSTVRAGNVIGGGDFAVDRIIPDCVRAAQYGEKILIRNPNSTRPYQFVLEALFAYLLIAQNQCNNKSLANNYNVGPNDSDCIQTGKLVELFCNMWGNNLEWKNIGENSVHEANFLKLDCSKLKHDMNWQPIYNINEAIKLTVSWYKNWINNDDIIAFSDKQIDEYMTLMKLRGMVCIK